MDFRIVLSLVASCTLLNASDKIIGSHPRQSPQSTAAPENQSNVYYYGPDSNNFYVQGDALVWQPYTQDALTWIDFRQYGDNTNLYLDQIKNLRYEWELGFRLAAGYRFGENVTGASIRPWQIETNYTQLLAHSSDSVPYQSGVSGTNFLINPVFPISDSFTPFYSGSSTVFLSYRQINTQFAWPIWVSQNVIWRLMTGAAYAWFHNSWNTVYSTVPIDSSDEGKRGNAYTDLSWVFKGGGLLASTDFHMEVGKGFGFFANGAIDLLVGRVSTKERYKQFAQRDTDPVSNADRGFHRTFTRFQPAFSFGAGLDYKHWFIPKRLMGYCSVGYEWMLWLDLNQFGRINERCDDTNGSGFPRITTLGNIFDAEPSSLGFHGATVRLGLQF